MNHRTRRTFLKMEINVTEVGVNEAKESWNIMEINI